MIHHISYWACSDNIQREFDFNDVTGAITSPVKGVTIDPSQACDDGSDFIYSDANWEIIATDSSPYGLVFSTTPPPCDLVITSVVIANSTDGNSNGSITINTTGSVTDYKIVGPVTIDWQPSNFFNALPPGLYQVYARNSGVVDCQASDPAIVMSIPTLVASISGVTNSSAFAANDGTISITITAGSGNYRITKLWDMTTIALSGANPQSTTIGSLPPDTYHFTVLDLDTSQSVNLEATTTEPGQTTGPLSNHFFVPKTQSFEFVHEETPDNCGIFQTLDNVRYCKQKHPYYTKTNYFQKVANCDKPKVQFQSNYESHEVKLFKYIGDEFVQNFAPIKKVQNIGVVSDFHIEIADNGAGTSRIYFDTSSLPLPLNAGDVVTVSANADGFDGNYAIQSVGDDLVNSSQYLIINLNYTAGGSRSSATGTFILNVLDFDIYESLIDFAAIPAGDYYLVATAFTGGNSGTPALSEPIRVAESFPDTNLLRFACDDNAFDIDYSTGILNFVRVESVFFKRFPSGKKETLRNTTGELRNLVSRKQRKTLFESFKLPPYLHEKLSVAYDMDYFSINGVEHQTEDEYKDPDYRVRYGLSNSSILLEQVSWFKTYNGDDLGASQVSQVAQSEHYQGRYNASSNQFPPNGGSGLGGSIGEGDEFYIDTPGTLKDQDEADVYCAKGCTVRALKANPGQLGANWKIYF